LFQLDPASARQLEELESTYKMTLRGDATEAEIVDKVTGKVYASATVFGSGDDVSLVAVQKAVRVAAGSPRPQTIAQIVEERDRLRDRLAAIEGKAAAPEPKASPAPPEPDVPLETRDLRQLLKANGVPIPANSDREGLIGLARARKLLHVPADVGGEGDAATQ